MEEMKEEIKTEAVMKEESPLIESKVDLQNITTTVKKEDKELSEGLVTVTKIENNSVKFDFQAKPEILTSLVKSCSGSDVKNDEDSLKKINLIKGITEVKNNKRDPLSSEISSKDDVEEIIEEVNVGHYESKDVEDSNMDIGEINCIVSLGPEDSLADENMEEVPSENEDKSNDCGEILECRESLLKVMKNVHALKQEPKHSCKTCGMEFKYKANCRKHEKLHEDIYRFRCKYCNISFKQSLTLKNHYIYVHETEKPYKCEECDSSFKSMNNLKSHIEVHHNFTGETFPCDFCHMEFKRRCYLQRHIGTHTNPDKKFTCADCGLKCRSKTDIAKHVLTHIGVVEKRFFCEICSAGFSKHAHVVRHRRTHSVEKSFACELCDRAYKDQYSLKTHHETVHLGITYSCEICGFQSDRYSLKKHLKRCEGQKKFTCETCHKEYYLKKWFEQHIAKCQSIQT